MIETQVPPLVISSCPVLVTSTDQGDDTYNISKETQFLMINVQELISVSFVCVNDVCGSLFKWCRNHESRHIQWNVISIFTRRYTSLLFGLLHKNESFNVVPLEKLHEWIMASSPQINVFEATFVPYNNTTMPQWLESTHHYLF